MNAKRAQTSNNPPKSRRFLLRRPMLLVTAAVLVLGSFACWGLWKRFGPSIVKGPEYRVGAGQITLSPEPPRWVRGDLSADVFRRAGWGAEQLSILDHGLREKIIQAFETHPWVEEVVRFSKTYPAQVTVQLVYRRPVAMVEIVDAKLYVVDASGVLLPFEAGDLAPNDVRSFPRINAGETPPASPIAGVPWPDQRILGGASVAAEIGLERWKKLGLYRISTLVNVGNMPPTFAITSKDEKIHVEWGHAPGSEQPGEASATEKLARLVTLIAQATEGNGPYVIDVRHSTETRPRTARRP